MQSLAALEAALTQHLTALRGAALGSPPGGGPAWDELLRHYGYTPLGPDARRASVAELRLTRGAVPAELRAVLAGLAQWARAEIEGLRLRGAGGEQPSFAALEQRIGGLVDAEMHAYERALQIAPPIAHPAPAPKPAAPSLASIFANAHATSKEVPWAGQRYEAVVSLTCTHCGAPQDKPDDFICRFCGRPIAGAP